MTTFVDDLLCLFEGTKDYSRSMMRDLATMISSGAIPLDHPTLPAIRTQLQVIRLTHPTLRKRWRARLAIEAIEAAEQLAGEKGGH